MKMTYWYEEKFMTIANFFLSKKKKYIFLLKTQKQATIQKRIELPKAAINN